MPDDISVELVAKLRERIENKMTGLRITDFQALPDHDHDGDPILGFKLSMMKRRENPSPLTHRRWRVTFVHY